MTLRSKALPFLVATLIVAFCIASAPAQNVKRIVIIKIDGLPGYYPDRFVKQLDPETGKSVLPWFEEVFYKNGTRVPNFYTRGMSLSGPSWGQLDSGQHLQIKGNVEYDRYTLRSYDYLNFFPYYLKYAFKKGADMPAVEVMDQLRIPILSDVFPYEKRYMSQQLYQRGNNWEVLASGFIKLYPGDPGDFIDEWTMGLDFRKVTINQSERDIIGKLVKRPDIDYFDYYDVSFDHVSHHNNDTASRLDALKDLDRLIGKIWLAIQASSRADETAMVLISDHGFNSDEKIYSQGFNLVKMLGSTAGGGHHVVTKRRLMLDYTVKGVYPLIPLIKTSSGNSYYLKGQNSDYPTALLDFDGNERSSIHLRNNDLNILHILLQQLKSEKLSPVVRSAATDLFFYTIDRHRAKWRLMLVELNEELDAQHRSIEVQQKIVAVQPKKFTPEDIALGLDKESRRKAALASLSADEEADYRAYAVTLNNLLNLKREFFSPKNLRIEDLIAPGSMGDPNSIFELQNYVVGVSASGLLLDPDDNIDLDKSLSRVNYFDLLHDQKVRSNVQPTVSNRPVDFVAVRIPALSFADSLQLEPNMNEDPIWLFGGQDNQALILSRINDEGVQSFRYLPVAGLRQESNGKAVFKSKDWTDGLPLKYFEDRDFAVPLAGRAAWLNEWHTELEWLNATHKTVYSNAIIGLNEQLNSHPLFDSDQTSISEDERLIRRFRQRQRHLTEADMLILANNHWNFDVRGFNPGGNHGSFFRVSTNSTFMIAGGPKTGIPRSLMVEEPYDGLSFIPTVLRLMGKTDDQNHPNPELAKRGFRKFPGRVIKEITGGRTLLSVRTNPKK